MGAKTIRCKVEEELCNGQIMLTHLNQLVQFNIGESAATRYNVPLEDGTIRSNMTCSCRKNQSKTTSPDQFIGNKGERRTKQSNLLNRIIKRLVRQDFLQDKWCSFFNKWLPKGEKRERTQISSNRNRRMYRHKKIKECYEQLYAKIKWTKFLKNTIGQNSHIRSNRYINRPISITLNQ